MLISFTYKKHPLYNSLFKEKNVIYSCLPITYKRCSYLLTLFDNLEGVLLDEEIIVSIYVNKKRRIIKTIKNIKNLHKNNIDTNDSFYDSHTSLLFINFQDISIEYVELDSYNISSLLMQEYKNENVQICYFNNYLDIITSTGTIIDNYNYDPLDTGFILPPIPHLQCLLQSELKPLSSSPVYNSNNKLCGILSHGTNDDNCRIYKIIPTILIIKSLEQNKNIYIFNECTIFTNIAYSFPIKEENGLYIVENSNITKKLKKGYVITSINGHSIFKNDTLIIGTNDTILIEKSTIETNKLIMPINTYIWLLSLEQITINKIKTCNMEDILQNYAENNDDSISISITNCQNNKKYVNKVKLYNVCKPSYKVYEPTFTRFKSGYILDVNEHIIKLLKLNRPVNNKPVNNDSIPVNNDSIPVNNDSIPVNNDSRPVNNDSRPVNNDSIPVNNDSIPVNNDSRPVNNDSIPVNNKPVNNDSIPVNNKPVNNKPVNNKPINNDILLYLWNNRFNEKSNKKLYFKRNKVQLLPYPN
jgi:hypothetical protein